jgi:diguanylate cyclase (GGDEF)-like protein/PAS domain S-box-containing protein
VNEFLHGLGQMQPHCILLDFRLGDMDGVACVQALRALSGQHVPVLMLIERDDDDAVLAAMQYGIQDYLFKDARGNYLTLLPAMLQKVLREQTIVRAKDKAEAALARLEHKYENLFVGMFENSPIGMALVGLDGCWLEVNKALCDIVGYDKAEMLAASVQDITHPDDLQIDQTFVQLVLLDQLKTYQMETRYFHKGGHAVPVMLSSSLVRDAEGEPLYFITKIEDITQRKKMEDALFAEKDLAQTTLQSIGDAVISTDAAGIIGYVNPVAERLTGWSSREACGQHFDHVFVIVQEGSREPVESPVRRALADGKTSNLASDTVLISRDGSEYFIDNSAAPIRLRDGRLTGAVMVFHDVTEQRMLSRKISYQASHDALTGLFNRSEFELTATRLLQSARILQRSHALLYLDLDQFKIVNDTCGHLAGDHLLRQLSATLLSHTRKSDLLARLGGDEFGILLEGCPQERAEGIAQNLVDTVRAFRFEWEGKLFSVGVSIGLVVIDALSGDLADVLRAADSACYEAKERGRNRYQVFALDLAPLTTQEQAARIDWVTRLREAVEQDRFALYYQRVQPIADPTACCSYEILLRYRDEAGRLLLPMAFIPAAERHGLLPAIDRWVITQLLNTPPAALMALDARTFVTVNISSASIADPQFTAFVLQALQDGVLPADRLCFEISEAAAITHLHNTMQFVEALRALGARISLDDFGGGLSSFSYLKSLPVDFLKIDGAIVKGVARDPVDAALVESICRIARVLGIASIAKCVESDAILERLAAIGLDYGQGFALHTPEAIS